MKTGQRIFDYYKELPVWAKGVVVIGAGSIAWFGIINPLRKLIIKKLDQAKEAKESAAAGKELNNLKKQGIVPTINKAQAESMSNQLRIAFNDCGTDEGAVYSVMSQMNNDADVYLLIDTYGIREYSGCGPWNVFSGSRNVGLSAAISDELDDMEKGIVNNILAQKGISFRFS